MLTFFLGYVCGALSVPTGWLMWLYFSGAYQGGAAFSELDFEEMEAEFKKQEKEQTTANVGHNSPQDK